MARSQQSATTTEPSEGSGTETQTSCPHDIEWLQLENQGQRADYLCGTELPNDAHTPIFSIVLASDRAFSPESIDSKGAILWLMRSVTGEHDSDSPAADQEELECVGQSLRQECSQGKVSTSLLEVPSLSTDQSKREGAE